VPIRLSVAFAVESARRSGYFCLEFRDDIIARSVEDCKPVEVINSIAGSKERSAMMIPKKLRRDRTTPR